MATPTRTVALKGGERYLNAISIFGPKRLGRVAARALRRMAETVQIKSRRGYLSGQALRRITGELFDSITFFTKKPSEWIRVGSPLPQAMPLHFGWPGHNLRPHPFLVPAIEDQERLEEK